MVDGMKYETFYAKEQAWEKVKELQELGHYVDWWTKDDFDVLPGSCITAYVVAWKPREK